MKPMFICVPVTTSAFRRFAGAGPRTLECGGGGGGGASGPDPEQSNTGYDVSGVSRKGGSAGEAFLSLF